MSSVEGDVPGICFAAGLCAAVAKPNTEAKMPANVHAQMIGRIPAGRRLPCDAEFRTLRMILLTPIQDGMPNLHSWFVKDLLWTKGHLVCRDSEIEDGIVF